MQTQFCVRFRILLIAFVSTVLMAGCGGPYYTIDGIMEAEVLTLHDGEKEIKVDLATAIGGALSGDAVDPDGKFVLEVDGVTVEGSVTPLRQVKVKNVEYKGKKVGLGTMADL